MKKFIIGLLVVLLAMPVFGTTTLAAETDHQNKQYEIPITSVKYPSYDMEVVDSFSDNAIITVEDDELYIELTHSGIEHLTSIEKANGVDVDVIENDLENDSRTVKFKFEGDLKEPIELLTTLVYSGEALLAANLYLDSETVTKTLEDIALNNEKNDSGSDEQNEESDIEEDTEPDENEDTNGNNEENPDAGIDEEENNNPDAPVNALIPDEAFTLNYKSDLDLGRYFLNPVTLLHKDGKKYIQITGNMRSFVEKLTINGEEILLSDALQNDTYIAQFEVDSIADEYEFAMHLTIMPKPHVAKLSFDETTLNVVDENNYSLLEPINEEVDDTNSESDELEEKEEDSSVDNNENDNTLTPDEAFTLNYESDLDLGRYFLNPVTLLHKDGKKYIQITGNMRSFVEKLTINGEEILLSDALQNDTYIAQFEVDSTADEYEFAMHLTIMPKPHVAKLWFDESSIDNVNVDEYQLLSIAVNSDENNEQAEENGNKNENEQNADENNGTDEVEKKSNPLAADEAYKVKISVFHETEDRPSAASGFFVEDAILLVKNGERYIQMTVTGKQYIDSLQSKFGEMIVVSETEDAIVYQFKIDGELSDVVWLDMIITVPGIYDQEAHKARLFIDQDSLVQVDESKYLLAAGDNLNGIITNPEISDPGIVKPELNEPETDETAPPASNNGNPTNNPQTGENTNLLMYVLLLVGSAVPLAIQARRRFVA